MKISGKQLHLDTYWHCSITHNQSSVVQRAVQEAEQIAGIVAEVDYQVVKYRRDGTALSLLDYADFFDTPFPELRTSWRVDLDGKSFVRRNYHRSINPPILHRKELLLSDDHPRRQEYEALSVACEELGLFDKTTVIGFRLAWQALIHQSGFRIDGHQLVALGNVDNDNEAGAFEIEQGVEINVERHRTALSRNNLSAPMQALSRHGYLNGDWSLFDYGCGKGDDLRTLQANNIRASGWDPYFAANAPKSESDLVNLGFVINVIESLPERIDALQGAWKLTRRLLVVSVMLYNQNSFQGQCYSDGVLTSRNTFQKYFTQSELKQFIESVLNFNAIAVGSGIMFVFRDEADEQQFLKKRYRSHGQRLQWVARQPRLTKPPIRKQRAEQRYQEQQALAEPIVQQWLTLGRAPDQSEVGNIDSLIDGFGSYKKALNWVHRQSDELLRAAEQQRRDDILIYLAMEAFSQRKPYRKLDASLQRDIIYHFGSYQRARNEALSLLYDLGDQDKIEEECCAAAEDGLGYIDNERALYVTVELLERLSPRLRLYVNSGTLLYGDISSINLVKIHARTGKLSLMRYDDFYGSPLPRLIERIKIRLRDQRLEWYQYSAEHVQPYLYIKSQYLHEEQYKYAEQLAFDEHIQSLGLFDFSRFGPGSQEFDQRLAALRWQIDGFLLKRSQTIPLLDDPCGQFLTYRDLVECGETWKREKLENRPIQPESYTALLTLAQIVIDPVIDYFGMIVLSYGFCSAKLARAIPGGIAPKRDQHAAHELNRLGNLICPRLGAACDFIVMDESMYEVARWIVDNTLFDRLYFYGDNKPIHVSVGPEEKREIIVMREGKHNLIPMVVSYEKFFEAMPI